MRLQRRFGKILAASHLSLGCLTACLASSSSAWAADPAATPAPALQGAIHESAPAPEPTVAEREAQELLRDLTIQRNAEIETELASCRLQIDELQRRLAATSSPSEQLAIQRAVEAAKQHNQIALLQIQARYADLAGKPEAAAEIRAQVEQLEQTAAGRLANPNH